jgi:hypothetical protein
MSAKVRPVLMALSENTVKLTRTVPPDTLTAGTPAACNTVKAEDGLVALSLAGLRAASFSAALMAPDEGGVGAGAVLPPPSPPPPQPAKTARASAAALHRVTLYIIDVSYRGARDHGASRRADQSFNGSLPL